MDIKISFRLCLKDKKQKFSYVRIFISFNCVSFFSTVSRRGEISLKYHEKTPIYF